MSVREDRLSQAVGQLLIIGFDGAEMSSRLGSLLRRIQPAGVILFARNIKSAAQTWRLLRACRQCVSPPLFTAVDVEGGTVDRFREVLGGTPSAAEVFATGDVHLFRKQGKIVGENCRALGFNLDFAPVLDLAFAASRAVMGSRAVSARAAETALYAREFLAGLKSAHVEGCGKHFPGLGEGKLDSHHQMPVIEKSMKQLWAEDLVPYRVLARVLPMAMISHAAFPAVTGDATPASLSKVWVTDVLRKRIGYRGLIVSDDLEMGGVVQAAPAGEAAVEFVRAGGDLSLICHREDYLLESYERLIQHAERDRQLAKRIFESSRRVLQFKKKAARELRPAKVPTAAVVEKLSRKLWEFGEQVRLAPLSRREDGRRA
jgi:beta-N-acetylhexosaminidase